MFLSKKTPTGALAIGGVLNKIKQDGSNMQNEGKLGQNLGFAH